MPISERTLRKWRKESLMFEERKQSYPSDFVKLFEEGAKRILKLTQELLDQHLMKRE